MPSEYLLLCSKIDSFIEKTFEFGPYELLATEIDRACVGLVEVCPENRDCIATLCDRLVLRGAIENGPPGFSWSGLRLRKLPARVLLKFAFAAALLRDATTFILCAATGA